MKFWTIRNKFLDVFFCMCVCLSIAFFVHSLSMYVHVCFNISVYTCAHTYPHVFEVLEIEILCALLTFTVVLQISNFLTTVYKATLFIIIGYRIFKQNHATKCMRYLLIRYCEWIKQNTLIVFKCYSIKNMN